MKREAIAPILSVTGLALLAVLAALSGCRRSADVDTDLEATVSQPYAHVFIGTIAPKDGGVPNSFVMQIGKVLKVPPDHNGRAWSADNIEFYSDRFSPSGQCIAIFFIGGHTVLKAILPNTPENRAEVKRALAED